MGQVDYSSLKILIVDDHKDVLITLRSMLRELGVVEVYEASSGDEGEVFLNAYLQMINLVICDWNLPNRSGLELLKVAQELKPEMTFIMVTGRNDVGSVVHAIEHGVNGYLRKPFSMAELDNQIQRAVLAQKAA